MRGEKKAALLPTGMSEEGGEVLGRIAAGFIGLQRQPNASDWYKESCTRRGRDRLRPRGRPAQKLLAVAGHIAPPHAPAMFVVTKAEAAAIRAVFQQRGEFAAAVELRRRFPGITDNVQARECARTIAGWQPLQPAKRLQRLRRVR